MKEVVTSLTLSYMVCVCVCVCVCVRARARACVGAVYSLFVLTICLSLNIRVCMSVCLFTYVCMCFYVYPCLYIVQLGHIAGTYFLLQEIINRFTC